MPGRLDPEIDDDRLVAETLELMRRHPRTPVTVVTNDINLQTKCDAADVPYVEPPEGGRRPRKEPRAPITILDLRPAGGFDGAVNFVVDVRNDSPGPVRATVKARVGGEAVGCSPATLDLLANTMPQQIHVEVPRPALGELVPELNHETTLYGETLTVDVDVDGRTASKNWNEVVYEKGGNSQRHAIQQRVWRIGKDAATEGERAQGA